MIGRLPVGVDVDDTPDTDPRWWCAVCGVSWRQRLDCWSCGAIGTMSVDPPAGWQLRKHRRRRTGGGVVSLCPEAEFRDSLSDGEFWEYVLLGIRPGDPQPADGDDDWDPLEPVALGVCPVCGANTACGYDEQGRALIHATDDEEAL